MTKIRSGVWSVTGRKPHPYPLSFGVLPPVLPMPEPARFAGPSYLSASRDAPPCIPTPSRPSPSRTPHTHFRAATADRTHGAGRPHIVEGSRVAPPTSRRPAPSPLPLLESARLILCPGTIVPHRALVIPTRPTPTPTTIMPRVHTDAPPLHRARAIRQAISQRACT